MSSSQNPASATVRYELAERQRVDFELKTKSTSIAGYFPVVRGDLEVDLMHLEKSRATLEVDLAAVRIESEDEREHRSYSATASNWLNLGSSIPEAARAERRWATFEISEVFDVSADAAHEGRLERRAKKAPPPESDRDAGETTGEVTGEVRKVLAKVRGPFSMNQRRMSEDASVSVSFGYPAEATPGFPPESIEVKTAQSPRISLDAYGVQPRNAEGVVIASDMKLLGSTVSSVARVSFSLTFRRKTQQP